MPNKTKLEIIVRTYLNVEFPEDFVSNVYTYACDRKIPNLTYEWIVCDENVMRDKKLFQNFAVELVNELKRHNFTNIIDYYIKRDEVTQLQSLYLVAHSRKYQGETKQRDVMDREDNEADSADTDVESRFGLNSHVTTLHKRLLCLESALLHLESASASIGCFLK